MTKTSKTLIFFGNERLVSGLKSTKAPILTGLIERGYNIKAVVSHHSNSKSRNNRPLEVAQIATKYNIPILLPERPSDISQQLAEYKADAAILLAYGRIIPQSIIDLFPLGIINIHPSLLPLYRGPTPIESAILDGVTNTGISIMQLSSGMDSGPIYAQADIKLKGNENKFEVYNKLSDLSTELLFNNLPAILNASIKPTAQDDSKASYCKLFKKSDQAIDPNKLTASQADRHVRACLGFPKTKLNLFGHDCIITKSHISYKKKSPLDILCRDGDFLSIDELIAPSGRLMNAESFIRGYTQAA